MIEDNLDILQIIVFHLQEWKYIFTFKLASKKWNRMKDLEINCSNIILEQSYENEIIRFMEYFPNCNYLHLGGNYLANKNINNKNNHLISYFRRLSKLEYYYNSKLLCNLNIWLPKLKSLSISGDNSITDEMLSYFPNLEYLYLPSNLIITDNSIQKLLKLKYLDLENNSNITDDSISKLLNLETLILDRNNHITNQGLKDLYKLKKLSIFVNTKITYEVFDNFKIEYLKIKDNIFNNDMNNITTIKELYISNGNTITDEFIKSLYNLEILQIEKNNLITDESIIHLINLKKLNLFTNTHLTNTILYYIKKLEVLYLHKNSNILLNNIVKKLPNIKIVHCKNYQYYQKN